MIDRGKRNLLGVLIDAVDYDGALERVLQAARSKQRCTCAAMAVHGVMMGARDAEHRYRLNHMDLLVPDGQPVRWGLNLLHRLELPDRVYGPELALRVCAVASREGLSIYLYGSRPQVIEQMVKNLKSRFPGLEIAGAEPSKFRRLTESEKDTVVQQIRDSGASLCLVGLGCPRQEVWVYEYGDELSMPLLAVGAAFDFIAGTLPQAPKGMQQIGLEWLYRFVQEPRRLWKRYLFLNPLYLLLLAQQFLHLRSFDPEAGSRPAGELRLG
jgi:exopolysaccharide biosynthesis WecB/TagA/CpsF family protein